MKTFQLHISLCHWQRLLPITVSFTLVACGGISPTPIPTTAPAVASPSPTLVPKVTATQMPTLAAAVASPVTLTSKQSDQCAPAEAKWKQVNSLAGFELHAGYGDEDGCSLWLVGEQVSPTRASVLARSVDGGHSLTVVKSFPYPEVFHLWRILFSDQTTAWVVGDNGEGQWSLWASSDTGQNWTPVQLPAPLSGPEALAASDGKVWAAANVDSRAVVFVTGDSGKHWDTAAQFVPPAPSAQSRLSALAVSGATIMAVWTDGAQNTVIVSQAGKDFQPVSDLAELTAVKEVVLVDPLHAYLNGYFTATGQMEDAAAVLLQSTDGGKQWKKFSIPDSPYIPDMLFTSNEQGYAISSIGPEIVILATGNGGQTWQPLPLEPALALPLEHLFRAGDKTLYAVGVGGLYRALP